MIGLLLLVAVVMIAVVGWAGLRRHGESPVPAGGWQATEEVFGDPSTGRIMRVWLDPIDNGRHYVAERAPERRPGDARSGDAEGPGDPGGPGRGRPRTQARGTEVPWDPI